MEQVTIQILGQTFTFSCEEDRIQSLHFAARDINDRLLKLKQKTKIHNMEQLLLSVALTLSSELCDEKNNDNLKKIQKKIADISYKIDHHLPKKS